MDKVLMITGASGGLGKELVKLRDYAFAPTHAELDITNEENVKNYFKNNKPDLLVHCAAYTKTLAAEKNPEEAYTCYQTNAIGTRNLAQYANCPIIYVSTESAIAPYNYYVLTKIMGELEIIRGKNPYQIIRTSFRERPFEYDLACTDVYTLGDYVDVMAKLINLQLDKPLNSETIYLGTGFKSTYNLAKQTKPDVTPISRKELHNHIPSFIELHNV